MGISEICFCCCVGDGQMQHGKEGIGVKQRYRYKRMARKTTCFPLQTAHNSPLLCNVVSSILTLFSIQPYQFFAGPSHSVPAFWYSQTYLRTKLKSTDRVSALQQSTDLTVQLSSLDSYLGLMCCVSCVNTVPASSQR